jgi:hypothetical protein
MGSDIYAGRSFLLPHHSKSPLHLWIVVTDPYQHELGSNKVVMVNVTTRTTFTNTNHNFCDITTILQPGDHEFIKHESVIQYSDANEAPVNSLEEYLLGNSTMIRDDLSNEILLRIQAGFHLSPYVPKKLLCRVQKPIHSC